MVGLNTDRSVRALKGPDRPVIRQNDRARVLAALASVDAVVLFDEETPLDLIKRLQPDVLAKGADYREEDVVGANEVKRWGGQVVLVPWWRTAARRESLRAWVHPFVIQRTGDIYANPEASSVDFVPSDRSLHTAMARFCILMYHMVTEPSSPGETRYACPPSRFESHMRTLSKKGYRLVSLTDVECCLSGAREMPPAAVAVTLDDGYVDNFTEAFPIIRQYDVPATVFLAVAAMGRTNSWISDGSRRRAMLDWTQVRAMQADGVRFGSHTLTHPRLTELDRGAAEHEIRGAKALLEDHLGERANWFAYPYGDLKEETLTLVREAGHTLACTTRSGFNHSDTEPLLLRRIEVCGTDSARTVERKIRFGDNEVGPGKILRYYLNRLGARLRKSVIMP